MNKTFEVVKSSKKDYYVTVVQELLKDDATIRDFNENMVSLEVDNDQDIDQIEDN